MTDDRQISDSGSDFHHGALKAAVDGLVEEALTTETDKMFFSCYMALAGIHAELRLARQERENPPAIPTHDELVAAINAVNARLDHHVIDHPGEVDRTPPDRVR